MFKVTPSPNIMQLHIPHLGYGLPERWRQEWPLQHLARSMGVPMRIRPHDMRSDRAFLPGSGLVHMPKPSYMRKAEDNVDKNRDAYPLLRAIAEMGKHLTPVGIRIDMHMDEPMRDYSLTDETRKAWEVIEAADDYDTCILEVSMDDEFAGETPAIAAQQLGRYHVGLDAYACLMTLYMTHKIHGGLHTATHHISCLGSKYDHRGRGKAMDTPRIDVELGHFGVDWNFAEDRARPLHVNAVWKNANQDYRPAT